MEKDKKIIEWQKEVYPKRLEGEKNIQPKDEGWKNIFEAQLHDPDKIVNPFKENALRNFHLETKS